MSKFKWKDLVGDYIELRNAYDLMVMENKNLWEQVAQHTRTIADYENRLQEQENETISVREQRDAVKRELAQLKLNINNQPTAADFEAISERYDELHDDYNSLVDDYNDSQSYIMKLKNKLKAAEDTILDLRHATFGKDNKIAELQDTVAALRLDIKMNQECENRVLDDKCDEIDELKQELQKLEADYKSLEDENEYLKVQSAIYGDDDDDLPWV